MAKKQRVLSVFPQPSVEQSYAQGMVRGIPYYMQQQEQEYRQRLAKYQEEQRQRERQENLSKELAKLDERKQQDLADQLWKFATDKNITDEMRQELLKNAPDELKKRWPVQIPEGQLYKEKAEPAGYGRRPWWMDPEDISPEAERERKLTRTKPQPSEFGQRPWWQDPADKSPEAQRQRELARTTPTAREKQAQYEATKKEKAALDTGDYRQLVSHYSQELKRMNDYYAALEEQKLAPSNKKKQHEYAVEQGRVHAMIQGLKKDHEKATRLLRTQTPVTVQSVASKTRQGLDAIPDFEKLYNDWHNQLTAMQQRTVEILLTSKVNPMTKEEVYRRYAKRIR